ncbi:hypothetical protein B566_EDAN018442 [Ephemera danica]|nr:hypothetical protein B566_EDAN018442 [Ephemera danica]
MPAAPPASLPCAPPAIHKGRAVTWLVPHRFERLAREAQAQELYLQDDEPPSARPITVVSEQVRSILSSNQSPDIGFDLSINPYRGCEHACIYCYARPTHSYLDLSPGIDFETRIIAKMNAPEVLRKSFASKAYEPAVLNIGSVTDPYQPVERKLQLTRRIVELALAVGQLHRRFHLHMAVQVARVAGANALDAFAPQAEGLAVLRALGYLDFRLAAQGGHFDAAAQGDAGQAHGHVAVQVITIALEDLVLLDANLDVQIARRAAVAAGLAIAGGTNAHAFVDAGRNLHFECLLALDAAGATAGGAGFGNRLARAAAGGAGLLNAEEALAHVHGAGAVAGATGLGRVGVNDVVVSRSGFGLRTTRLAAGRTARRRTGRTGRSTGRSGFSLRIGIDLFAQLLAGRHQGLGLGVEHVLVVALQCFLGFFQGSFDLALFIGFELVAMFGQALFHRMHHGVGLVACLHQFQLAGVFGGVELGVLHHLLDLGLAQARVRLDGDLVFLARAFVLGVHVQDAVSVDIEGDFDLRHAARRRGNAFEVELAQALVARGQFPLALEHLDGDCGLGQHILGEIDALLFLELGDDEIDDALVEIFTAQEGVAVGAEHFELLLAIDIGDLDDRNIESATAQVVHRDLAVALAVLVQAEGQGRGGGLVDDALDIQAGDAAGVLGGLALAVVEVGGHGDDGLGDFFTQIVFRCFLHLAQHFGADLRRRHLLAAHFDPGVTVVGGGDLEGHQLDVLLHFLFSELAPDQALGGVHRVARVRDRLALGAGAHEHFAVFLVGNDRGRGARTLAVLDHLGGVAFHDGHARVGGAQVDADDLSHFLWLLKRIAWMSLDV